MRTSGPLALLGSGEYTAAMHTTDQMLLDALARPAPRVALIPTASGMEEGSPERWNTMGVNHFRALGATPLPLPLITRADAYSEPIVAALAQADFYYFSGGSPEYVVETLYDTPAWQTIMAGWGAGAALAGCSAGAMMLGGHTIRVRSVAQGHPPNWVPALAVVPEVAVLPHFDRMAGFVGVELFQAIIASAPTNTRLLGIDEDTALVRLTSEAPWQVFGRQTVSRFSPDGSRDVFGRGATLAL